MHLILSFKLIESPFLINFEKALCFNQTFLNTYTCRVFKVLLSYKSGASSHICLPPPISINEDRTKVTQDVNKIMLLNKFPELKNDNDKLYSRD